MALSGFMRKIKTLEILNEEQMESIHRGTLDVLENTGIRFESKEALDIFKKNDCNVDYKINRVRFPSYLVEETLRRCPSSFTVKSRNSDRDIRIGGNYTYFANMPGMRIVDLNTWETRPATRKENKEALIVLDALPNFHLFSSYTPYFEIEGVSPNMAIPESYADKIRNSSKVSWEGYQNNCELFIIEMSKAIKQEVIGICLPSPPLTYQEDACKAGIRYAEQGFPINIANSCIMGGTSPITIAASLISFNAEVIGAIMLTQFVRLGTRIMIEDGSLPMNMKTGSPIFDAITASLHMAAFSQIWRNYKIPTFVDTGWVNSKKIDFQCGYEKAIASTITALAGCNVIILHGGIHGELAYHPVQSILDDDIAGEIGRFLEGIELNDETLAVDLIKKVGPIPGYFPR